MFKSFFLDTQVEVSRSQEQDWGHGPGSWPIRRQQKGSATSGPALQIPCGNGFISFSHWFFHPVKYFFYPLPIFFHILWFSDYFWLLKYSLIMFKFSAFKTFPTLFPSTSYSGSGFSEWRKIVGMACTYPNPSSLFCIETLMLGSGRKGRDMGSSSMTVYLSLIQWVPGLSLIHFHFVWCS